MFEQLNSERENITAEETKVEHVHEAKSRGIRKLTIKKKWLLIPAIVLVIFLLIGAGIGVYARGVYQKVLPEKIIAESNLIEMRTAVKSQDIVKIKTSNQKLKDQVGRLETVISQYGYLSKLPMIKNYYQDVQSALGAGKSGTKLLDLLITSIEPYKDLLGLGSAAEVKGKTTMDRITFLVTTLDKIRPQVDQIGQELITIRTQIDRINPNRYPENFQGVALRKNLRAGIELIDQASALVNDAKPLLEVAPDLLGINTPKYYFVLFQNDAELRPTGGFMTAYGILKVDQGRITPILSEDMYSLDAKYTKKVSPPEPIVKYLKDIGGKTMTRWYIRDMNFSPDFAVSMKSFTDIYNNQISGARKVDGVIAVDTQLLASLLKVLGSIGVPEWGNFSADNDKRCDCPQVVYRLEEIADKPISGMNVSRKAVIGPLMHSILANAFNSPKDKISALVSVGIAAVNQKHVLFYLFDEKAQKAVEAFNMAGRVRETQGDYTMLIDTNLGGAKSDLFIDRKIDQTIETGADGIVTKTVTVTYNNPFKASNCNLLAGELCLNGLYRNYFRLYVPLGSKLLESTGSEVEVTTSEDLGKTVFAGFYGDKAPLRPQSKTKVSFKYQLPFKAISGEVYKLLIQKQPGIDRYAYSVTYNGKVDEFELVADKEIQW